MYFLPLQLSSLSLSLCFCLCFCLCVSASASASASDCFFIVPRMIDSSFLVNALSFIYAYVFSAFDRFIYGSFCSVFLFKLLLNCDSWPSLFMVFRYCCCCHHQKILSFFGSQLLILSRIVYFQWYVSPILFCTPSFVLKSVLVFFLLAFISYFVCSFQAFLIDSQLKMFISSIIYVCMFRLKQYRNIVPSANGSTA